MTTNSKYLLIIIIAFVFSISGITSHAAAKIEIDESKWLSIGAGLRTSFTAVEDAAGADNDSWSSDFALDNIRLYANGQVTDYLSLEFNTECQNCSDGGDLRVLDAIVKFELPAGIHVWVGRQLVPADRAELSGPFYQTIYQFDKTPFYPSDFGNDAAGRFGRDDGVNAWGEAGPEGRFRWVAGIFDGVDGGPNVDDNLLIGGRVAYNFWNVEDNPGFYLSSGYFGTQGDIFTLGLAVQHQADGAGTAAAPGDFTGITFDFLLEKTIGTAVLTVNAEYKDFDAGLTASALADVDCFCLFEGKSWTASAMYLLGGSTGIGRLQPYARYVSNEPDNSSDRDELEIGVNYVIDGFNARFSAWYQYGDIATKGRNWVPGVTGEDVSAIGIGLQFQL